jgi:hypothetical protein
VLALEEPAFLRHDMQTPPVDQIAMFPQRHAGPASLPDKLIQVLLLAQVHHLVAEFHRRDVG